MTINCQLKECDYRAFRHYIWFDYRKMHWYFAGLAIGLLALVWFTDKPDATLPEKIAGLIVTIILWVLLLSVGLVFWKVVTLLTGGRFQGPVGLHVFEITDDMFSESNAHGRQEVRVSGLRRVAETKAHFFVITNPGTAYVIPKRDLETYDAIYELQKKVDLKSADPGAAPDSPRAMAVQKSAGITNTKPESEAPADGGGR